MIAILEFIEVNPKIHSETTMGVMPACSLGRTNFSIGHCGAAMQFPGHARQSYEAAARMGAGIVECDVIFITDKELVCRHAQNDLHTATNILATPLAAKCTKPFAPAIPRRRKSSDTG